MPSFDAIAGAALTPGGVQHGMNDLVAALVNGPIRRRQIEMQQAQIQSENEFRNQQFGEQMAARLADDGRGDRGLSETIRHNQATEGLARDGKLSAIAAKNASRADEIEAAAERAALAEMGAGFTSKGRKLARGKKYITTWNPETGGDDIIEKEGDYSEVPWDANDETTFRTKKDAHRARLLNPAGGVADIADQLGQPNVSTNPGVASRAQIAAIAQKHGKSLAEAEAKYVQAGFTITD